MKGRPRQFEEAQALGKAVEVFWKKGYEATSVQDLVDAMGINRGSMYCCFGDKHELFLKSLELYRERMISGMVTILEAPGSPIANIESFLRSAAAMAAAPECRGCLATNATVETAPHDPEVARRIGSVMQSVEKAFRRTLERAAEEGELKPGTDPRSVARFLTAALQGIVVMGKARAGRGTLDDVVDVALGLLH